MSKFYTWIPIDQATAYELQIAANGEGFDELSDQHTSAIYAQVPTKRQVRLLVKTLKDNNFNFITVDEYNRFNGPQGMVDFDVCLLQP